LELKVIITRPGVGANGVNPDTFYQGMMEGQNNQVSGPNYFEGPNNVASMMKYMKRLNKAEDRVDKQWQDLDKSDRLMDFPEQDPNLKYGQDMQDSNLKYAYDMGSQLAMEQYGDPYEGYYEPEMNEMAPGMNQAMMYAALPSVIGNLGAMALPRQEQQSGTDRLFKAGPAMGAIGGGALAARRSAGLPPKARALAALMGAGTGAGVGWLPDVLRTGYRSATNTG
jgi:hypothetical protein